MAPRDSEIARHKIENCRSATTFGDRFLGLMGRRDLSRAFLLIPECSSIHTCFMLGAIDILFLDGEHRVLRVRSSLKPWRLLGGPKGTRDILELPPGYAREHGIESGDVIECQLG